MSQSKGNTTGRMPKGMPYIVTNEAAERFSFYGMKAILVIFMTSYLLDSAGGENFFSEAKANQWYHDFASAVYFFPILGALVSDIFWGKYKTILYLSIVYCLGHLTLAFMDIPFAIALLEPKTWLAVGLGLIAVGSGGIKPCVSAHLGDQVGPEDKGVLSKLFGYFYFAINFGSFFSIITTPWLLRTYGPAVAFGVPGVLMFIATLLFYFGRHTFVAMPPVGWDVYKRDMFSPKGLKSLFGLGMLYLFIAVFWALFDQTGSSWVFQAKKLDRMVDLGFMQFEVFPSQIQAINPVLIMMFIPLFTYVIYPFFGRFTKVTPLRKIGAGFFITAASFAMVAMLEQWIQDGHTPSMLWQFGAFVVITAAEVLISITALEFSYSQAPNSMKSFIMAVFLLSVSLGNKLVAFVNGFIERAEGSMAALFEGANYFWFFTYLILIAGALYVIASRFYQEETHLQDHSKAVDH